MERLIALLVGATLDALIGDPLWLPHPVQGIGLLIAGLERLLRRLCPKTAAGQRVAGSILVLTVGAASFLIPWALLLLAGRVHPYARLALESLFCWQLLACKGLRDAAHRVYVPLAAGRLEEARQALSMIVGRDTASLDEEGISRAAVETVAENTGDGVVAPLIYFALGGAPLGFLYKGINTMDSMLGYRNERYRYFGWAAARLDDLANLLPARLTALLLVLAAPCCRLDARQSWRILCRDRYRHPSPNSGWPEAACAGALGIRLGGVSQYGGREVDKPTLGDATRPIEPLDIRRAMRLELTATILCVTLCAAGLGLLLWIGGTV